MGATVADLTFKPKWLIVLVIGAGSLVLFNGAFPGGGVAIAAGIALIWLTRADVFHAVSTLLASLRRMASNV
jgi:hypothetical protein